MAKSGAKKSTVKRKTTSTKTKKSQKFKPLDQSLLLEVSWEACNQVGGIYTVLRSKVSAMIEEWGDDYCLIGPYIDDQIQAELDPLPYGQDIYGKAAQNMERAGFKVHYARWLITGRPKVILLDINEVKANFDSVVLCLGSTKPRDLPVPGRELKGIHFAMVR